MNKYTFVVMERERAEFLARLQALGLVDVTTTGWEPTEEDRAHISLIERHREAVEYLAKLRSAKDFVPGEAFDTGAEAFGKYETARNETAALEAEIARNEKLADEVRPWGNYNPETVRELASRGIVIKYFTAPESEFAKKRNEWSETCALEKINDIKGIGYFVAVASTGEEINIDAQEVRLPAESIETIDARLAGLKAELRSWDKVFAQAAATLPAIEAEEEHLKDTLQFRQSSVSGRAAADGALVVMEAWARENQQAEVDAMLDACPEVIFIKERPTPDDETPVELRNARLVRPFEFIGEMYALPRYGTMDLTRWFAPFYMLFFAFCLADAGYGLLLFLGGLYLAIKATGSMKTIGTLSMWCGGASVVFGFLVGSFFGIDIKQWGIFAGKPLFFPTEDDMFLFKLALGLGVLQIMFGLTLKAITTARAFGLKYALATIGWLIVLLAGIVMMVPGMLGFELAIPKLALYIAMGVGGFMMLFLNNPGKNPLVNLGGGLWNTYNDILGFLSDALSYIRLFAIGLSGGVLAMVFNKLASGLSPDIPVVKQLVMLIILLIGHGLNLFMSTLSSMVHPLRLTFVEFYKNSGFEVAERAFNPLKKNTKNK